MRRYVYNIEEKSIINIDNAFLTVGDISFVLNKMNNEQLNEIGFCNVVYKKKKALRFYTAIEKINFKNNVCTVSYNYVEKNIDFISREIIKDINIFFDSIEKDMFILFEQTKIKCDSSNMSILMEKKYISDNMVYDYNGEKKYIKNFDALIFKCISHRNRITNKKNEIIYNIKTAKNSSALIEYYETYIRKFLKNYEYYI